MKKLFVFIGLILLQIQLSADQNNNVDSISLFSYLLSKADSFRMAENNEKAIAIYKQIVDNDDSRLTAFNRGIYLQALINLVDLYFGQGKYTESLDVLIHGIKLAELYNDNNDKLALLYLKSGNVYSVFEDHEKAMAYYQNGLKYAELLTDNELQARFLNNMTACYCYMGNVDKAKEFNKRASQLPLNNPNIQKYIGYLNLGLINMTEGNLISAVNRYKQSIKVATKHNLSPRYLAASYSEIFKIFEEASMVDSAIYYLELYRELSEQNQYANMLIDCYKNLSELYAQTDNTEKSMYYQNKYVVLSDSIMNMREFNRVRNEHQSYEEGKKQKYISRLNTTISTQKSVMIVIISFLFLVIVLLLLIYRQKKALQDAYEGLFQKNKELIKIETKYTEALKQIRQQNADKIANESAELAQPENTNSEDENYKTSGLSVEQKEKLLKSINKIMESTDLICNPDFSLSSMANQIGSNTKYVSQVINETYNVNFRTYINEYRIKESCKRLSDIETYGNYTIKAIAESVGYKSQSNFIATFRKVTGITPSFYQQMAQKDNS